MYFFCDDIVCHVAGATAKVATRPQVASPKLLLQMRELGQQVMRRAAFPPLHFKDSVLARRYSAIPEVYLARTR
jgi:hypothetical protein